MLQTKNISPTEEYEYKVETPTFSNYSLQLNWCFKCCVGNFYDAFANNKQYWYFENEDDMISFMLTWC